METAKKKGFEREIEETKKKKAVKSKDEKKKNMRGEEQGRGHVPSNRNKNGSSRSKSSQLISFAEVMQMQMQMKQQSKRRNPQEQTSQARSTILPPPPPSQIKHNGASHVLNEKGRSDQSKQPLEKIRSERSVSNGAAKESKSSVLQVAQQRKKKLSTLKKVILRDRMVKWHELQPLSSSSSASQTTVLRGVVVYNMLDPQELCDADEVEEIVHDINEQFRAYGTIESLLVPSAHVLSHHFPLGTLFVLYASPEEAKDAVEKTKERAFGSRVVQSDLIAAHEFYEVLKTYNRALQDRPEDRIIRIQNLVALEEIEDEDERADTCFDIRTQFEEYGPIDEVYIPQTDASRDIVYVKFQTSDAAKNAIEGANGKVFGGRQIVVDQEASKQILEVLGIEMVDDAKQDHVDENVCKMVCVSGFFPIDKLQKDSCELYNIKKEAFSYFSALGAIVSVDVCMGVGSGSGDISFGKLGDVIIEFEDCNVATKTCQTYDGSLYLNRPLIVRSLARNANDSSTHSPLIKLPKLPSRSYIREYVDDAVDQDICPMVTELLSKLMAFQERARLKDPIKGKKRRRLVFGLREVKRGVKNGKIIFLVVAYNIDECSAEGGLDDQVIDIIQEARQRDVLIIYSLSRKRLGKALSKTIRVSCAGIYNVDGANELYNQLKRTIMLKRRSSNDNNSNNNPN